jgi:lysophospholipase L1-like esterase
VAFWKFIGTTSQAFPEYGMTAQPGQVYSFSSDGPPAAPTPNNQDRPPAVNVASTLWTSNPGPASDNSLSDDLPNLPATYARAAQGRPGNLVVALGDSTTADGDLEPGINGGTTSLYADSWFTYATLLSGQRITRVKNAGISGNTTTQMLARVQADVVAYAPSACTILGGTNDIGTCVSAGGAVPDATAFALFQSNIRAIVGACRAASILPVLVTILPNNTSNRHALISKWNLWLRRYAAASGIPLLDFYAQAADPATGNYSTAMASGDGIHPGNAGLLILGTYASTTLAPLLPPNKPQLTVDDTDANNLLAHGLFLGGALNGQGVPPGWSINSGFPTGLTVSYVTDSAVPGNMWQAAAAASSGLYEIISPVFSGWSVGDTIALSGVVTSNAGVTPQVQLKDQTGQFAKPFQSGQAVTRGVFYQECVVRAGATSLRFSIVIPQGTGTFSVGQLSAYNLTTLGILAP